MAKGKINSNFVFRSCTVCFWWLLFLWCFLLFFGVRQCLVIILYAFVTLKRRYSSKYLFREAVQIIMCGWTFPFQVEAVKEMLYQLEETYLKKKALRATKQQKAKEKKALKKLSLRSPAVPPQGQPSGRPSAQSSNKWAPTPQTLIFCQEVGHSTGPLECHFTLREINGLCGRTIIQICLLSNHPSFILRPSPWH